MHILFWIWFENCFLPWHRRLPEESWNPRLRHCFYFLVCCNKSPQPSGSNHRNVLSNSSRGLWPGIKVSAGLCSLQVLLTSGGLLTIFGVSCLYAYLHISLCLHIHKAFFLCIGGCVQFLIFIRSAVILD